MRRRVRQTDRRSSHRTFYRSCGKRAFDVVVASGLLLVSLPLMAVVALLVRWRLGSPVLFRQTRPGLRGEPFTLTKFRSMRDAVGPDGVVLPDEARLTKFGTWLRSTSLDEIPELFQVLSGSMSLVGPRPLLTMYLDRYTDRQARRHEVLPGITGWAQVNGRNSTDWATRMELDVWYVDHVSLLTDLRVLARTARSVVGRHGINADGHVTMPNFLGSVDPSAGTAEAGAANVGTAAAGAANAGTAAAPFEPLIATPRQSAPPSSDSAEDAHRQADSGPERRIAKPSRVR